MRDMGKSGVRCLRYRYLHLYIGPDVRYSWRWCRCYLRTQPSMNVIPGESHLTWSSSNGMCYHDRPDKLAHADVYTTCGNRHALSRRARAGAATITTWSATPACSGGNSVITQGSLLAYTSWSCAAFKFTLVASAATERCASVVYVSSAVRNGITSMVVRGADPHRYGLGHILDTDMTGLHCMVMTTTSSKVVRHERVQILSSFWPLETCTNETMACEFLSMLHFLELIRQKPHGNLTVLMQMEIERGGGTDMPWQRNPGSCPRPAKLRPR
jgi:hypothetical protein